MAGRQLRVAVELERRLCQPEDAEVGEVRIPRRLQRRKRNRNLKVVVVMLRPPRPGVAVVPRPRLLCLGKTRDRMRQQPVVVEGAVNRGRPERRPVDVDVDGMLRPQRPEPVVVAGERTLNPPRPHRTPHSCPRRDYPSPAETWVACGVQAADDAADSEEIVRDVSTTLVV